MLGNGNVASATKGGKSAHEPAGVPRATKLKTRNCERSVEIRSGCPTYLTAGFPGKETPRLSPRYNTGNDMAAERRVGLREEPPKQTEMGKN